MPNGKASGGPCEGEDPRRAGAVRPRGYGGPAQAGGGECRQGAQELGGPGTCVNLLRSVGKVLEAGSVGTL